MREKVIFSFIILGGLYIVAMEWVVINATESILVIIVAVLFAILGWGLVIFGLNKWIRSLWK